MQAVIDSIYASVPERLLELAGPLRFLVTGPLGTERVVNMLAGYDAIPIDAAIYKKRDVYVYINMSTNVQPCIHTAYFHDSEKLVIGKNTGSRISYAICRLANYDQSYIVPYLVVLYAMSAFDDLPDLLPSTSIIVITDELTQQSAYALLEKVSKISGYIAILDDACEIGGQLLFVDELIKFIAEYLTTDKTVSGNYCEMIYGCVLPNAVDASDIDDVSSIPDISSMQYIEHNVHVPDILALFFGYTPRSPGSIMITREENSRLSELYGTAHACAGCLSGDCTGTSSHITRYWKNLDDILDRYASKRIVLPELVGYSVCDDITFARSSQIYDSIGALYRHIIEIVDREHLYAYNALDKLCDDFRQLSMMSYYVIPSELMELARTIYRARRCDPDLVNTHEYIESTENITEEGVLKYLKSDHGMHNAVIRYKRELNSIFDDLAYVTDIDGVDFDEEILHEDDDDDSYYDDDDSYYDDSDN
jgi:hypothetical protein